MFKHLPHALALAATLGLTAPLAAQDADRQALQEDAECLVVFNGLLASFLASGEQDTDTSNGFYAFVGYFSGKIAARVGIAAVETVVTRDLADRVDADLEAVTARCMAEAGMLGAAMVAAHDASKSD